MGMQSFVLINSLKYSLKLRMMHCSYFCKVPWAVLWEPRQFARVAQEFDLIGHGHNRSLRFCYLTMGFVLNNSFICVIVLNLIVSALLVWFCTVRLISNT